MKLCAALMSLLLLSALGSAQNWKQVHKKDEEKWAKATGLDVFTVHKLWRAASNVPDENDDDSRIANIDLDGLAERHELLLVTYAGENNCLRLTVFLKLSDTKFDKVWSADHAPDGTEFCDSSIGTAKAYAENGAVLVRVPPATAAAGNYVLYRYEWNGITYRAVKSAAVSGQ
jgi:hypothetical protein